VATRERIGSWPRVEVMFQMLGICSTISHDSSDSRRSFLSRSTRTSRIPASFSHHFARNVCARARKAPTKTGNGIFTCVRVRICVRMHVRLRMNVRGLCECTRVRVSMASIFLKRATILCRWQGIVVLR